LKQEVNSKKLKNKLDKTFTMI
jgi:hypothetical protein